MRNYLTLLTLIILLASQLTFAQVVPPTPLQQDKASLKIQKTHPSSKEVKKREVSKEKKMKAFKSSTATPATTTPEAYKACVGKQVSALTIEMRAKKKEALNEFKTAYKNATTTEAKKEIKKVYTRKIREINRWFNQEVRRIKAECRSSISPAATTTSATSTTTTTPTTTEETTSQTE